MGTEGVVDGPVGTKILFSDQFGAFPFICALGIQIESLVRPRKSSKPYISSNNS